MAGMPSSTEVIAPLVDVEAHDASNSANAETGSMLKVKGSNSTKPMAPPKPGIAPKRMPITQPSAKWARTSH